MRITNIAANIADKNHNNLLAYVNVVFDDCFIVRGIRVVEKIDGKRLMLMPSRQTKAGTYRDTCHPITSDFRMMLEIAVMSKVLSLLNTQEHEYAT